MPAKEIGALIAAVDPASPCACAGIAAGERLLAINGQPLRDLIDYLSLAAASDLSLTVSGVSGRREVRLHKDEEASLGLSFPEAVFDGIKRCRNHCVFCFVDQLPPSARSTLCIKDEDYRLSFLQGNYVTLTGLGALDKTRIMTCRLSPLYVSVHAVEPSLRGKLLGLPHAAPILPLLRELTAAGIRIQAQAVICPGWNDGPALQQTMEALAALWPGVQSLAIVPVGLTRHRRDLTALRPFGRVSAKALLASVEAFQATCLQKMGTRFVYAADEFHLLAGAAFPAGGAYEDYPQLENGVGLIRAFEDEFRAAWRRWRPRLSPGYIRVVTGVAAAGMWRRLARPLATAGVQLEILPVRNGFFGETVTVTGLLAGEDIVQAMANLPRRPTFVPRIIVQRGGDLLLDGMTVAALIDKTGVEVIETDPVAFLAGATRALGQ